MNPMRGRTALLTGATGAIGGHIARALAARGVHLALTARDGPALDGLADSLRGHGVRCTPVPADLARPDAGKLLDRVEAAAGPVDILVHNAAVEICARFHRLDPAEVDRILRVNLAAPVELTRLAVDRMLARGRGRVVFVSSVSGLTGTAFQAPYAATKAALVALCASLRAEYADTPLGFCVVAPGPVGEEGMFARARADGVRVPRALRPTPPERVAAAVTRAVTTDAPLIAVPPASVRAVLVLNAVAPRAAERLVARLGLGRLFEPAARARGRG